MKILPIQTQINTNSNKKTNSIGVQNIALVSKADKITFKGKEKAPNLLIKFLSKFKSSTSQKTVEQAKEPLILQLKKSSINPVRTLLKKHDYPASNSFSPFLKQIGKGLIDGNMEVCNTTGYEIICNSVSNKVRDTKNKRIILFIDNVGSGEKKIAIKLEKGIDDSYTPGIVLQSKKEQKLFQDISSLIRVFDNEKALKNKGASLKKALDDFEKELPTKQAELAGKKAKAMKPFKK